jgi:hypothetical protein
MGGFFKGDFGQYFTPRELIGFAVELLNPQRKQLVLDPLAVPVAFFFTHSTRSAARPTIVFRTIALMRSRVLTTEHSGMTLRKRTSSALKSTRS